MRAVTAPACRGRRPSSPRRYIPAAKAPHFFRLGDVEVNAGQNASFQCMAAGRAAEAEHFLLQVRRVGPWPKGVGGFFRALALSALSGASIPPGTAQWGQDSCHSLRRVRGRWGRSPPASLTRSPLSLLEQRQSGALVPAAGVRHISHRRFLATFPLAAVGREEQDLYRCVSQAPRGAGVSNFAELIVKGQRSRARGGGADGWRGRVCRGGACRAGSVSPEKRSDRGSGGLMERPGLRVGVGGRGKV